MDKFNNIGQLNTCVCQKELKNSNYLSDITFKLITINTHKYDTKKKIFN